MLNETSNSLISIGDYKDKKMIHSGETRNIRVSLDSSNTYEDTILIAEVSDYNHYNSVYNFGYTRTF